MNEKQYYMIIKTKDGRIIRWLETVLPHMTECEIKVISN